MDLFEYQGKQYFARYDIPVSPGGPADTVDEAVTEANQAGYPVVVKAQVQVGGRGKAGGIKLADNEAESLSLQGTLAQREEEVDKLQNNRWESFSKVASDWARSRGSKKASKAHQLSGRRGTSGGQPLGEGCVWVADLETPKGQWRRGFRVSCP